jgi:hypothetical protein
MPPRLQPAATSARRLALSVVATSVVIPSHDLNVIFSLANNRSSVIVFY